METEQKNYYFKEDQLAYTEDNLLVYNVFVYKIPHRVSESQALQYFSLFGKVQKLSLISDKKRTRHGAPKVGYINFASPVSAANVLLKQNHYLQMKRICVRASDSLYQPVPCPEDLTKPAFDANEASLLSVNDDCLMSICRQLHLSDQLRFAQSTERFFQTFQRLSKVEHKEFNLYQLDGLTLLEIQICFRVIGDNIQSIVGSIPEKDQLRIVGLIAKYCCKLRKIEFSNFAVKPAILSKLFVRLKNVTYLQLHDCSLNDSAIFHIKNLPKLETLIVTGSFKLSGKNFDRFKMIKHLSVCGCVNIQSGYFMKMCQSLTQLESLNIQHCERLTTAAYREMSLKCINIKMLKVTCPTGVENECIADMPSLKQLEIVANSWQELRNQLFAAIAAQKAEQLELFSIGGKDWLNESRVYEIIQLKNLKSLTCSNNSTLSDKFMRTFAKLEYLEEFIIKHCQNVTDAGALFLVENCKNLVMLNMHSCSKITNEFVLGAIRIIKQRMYKLERQITFVLNKTGVSSDIRQHAEFKDAPELLHFRF